MTGVIDADTHIAESESMWKLLDPEMYPRRPVIARIPDDTLYGKWDAMWLIDGNIFPKPAGKGGFRLITPSISKVQASRGDIEIACREITDAQARLAAMDKMGVDIQVVYPTLFLIYLTDDVELDVALCRAYNRWMADVWSRAGKRIRWVAMPPLRSVEESIKEMKTAKQNGAVGVMFRGMEGTLTLDNPYFFPIYEEAAGLDLPICIHTGSGVPQLIELFNLERNRQWAHGGFLPLHAFRDIVLNGIPEMFPELRFGFIEAAASWIPFLVHKLRRDGSRRWKWKSSVDLFKEYRLFVACEADEDIPYLAKFTGEDHLLIGSDYGHNDPAEEIGFVSGIRSREDVPPELAERLLCKNPREFYPL